MKRGDLQLIFFLLFTVSRRAVLVIVDGRGATVLPREELIEYKIRDSYKVTANTRIVLTRFYVRTGRPVRYIVILSANVAVFARGLRNRLGPIGLKRFSQRSGVPDTLTHKRRR